MPSPESLEDLRSAYLSGRDPLAYVPYASRLLEEKQLAQALDLVVRGLEMRPSLSGRRLLAQIYFEMGRYQDCLQTVDLVLKAAPESFSAKMLLARTYSRCGRWEEACALFQELRQQNPHDEELIALEEQVRAELERSEQPTPVEIEPGSEPERRKQQLCEQFSLQPGVGFCFFQTPLEGNVLETNDVQQLLGVILDKSIRIAETLKLGRFQELMMEYEQGYVLARRAGEDFLIAQFKAGGISPGQMRQSLSRYAL